MIDEHNAKLSAFVLNDIDEKSKREITNILLLSTDTRAFKRELEGTVEYLMREFKGDDPDPLSADARHDLERYWEAQNQKETRLFFLKWFIVIPFVTVAIVTIIVALIDFSHIRWANWKIGITQIERDSKSTEADTRARLETSISVPAQSAPQAATDFRLPLHGYLEAKKDIIKGKIPRAKDVNGAHLVHLIDLSSHRSVPRERTTAELAYRDERRAILRVDLPLGRAWLDSNQNVSVIINPRSLTQTTREKTESFISELLVNSRGQVKLFKSTQEGLFLIANNSHLKSATENLKTLDRLLRHEETSEEAGTEQTTLDVAKTSSQIVLINEKKFDEFSGVRGVWFHSDSGQWTDLAGKEVKDQRLQFDLWTDPEQVEEIFDLTMGERRETGEIDVRLQPHLVENYETRFFSLKLAARTQSSRPIAVIKSREGQSIEARIDPRHTPSPDMKEAVSLLDFFDGLNSSTGPTRDEVKGVLESAIEKPHQNKRTFRSDVIDFVRAIEHLLGQ